MSESVLWYQKPAEDFNSALPVGNGRIGGMVYGKPENELIQLNEDSVWSGGCLLYTSDAADERYSV